MDYYKLAYKIYVITFIYSQKAYDSINVFYLISTLKVIGLDNKTTNLIKATPTKHTYSKKKSRVKFPNCLKSKLKSDKEMFVNCKKKEKSNQESI